MSDTESTIELEVLEGHSNDALGRAKTRRNGLHRAMTRSEAAVAGPSSWPGWLNEVDASLAELRQAVDEHIVEVEGPDGLLAEIMLSTPRLAPDVEVLRREHRELVSALVRARETSRAVATDPAHDPIRLRRAVTSLLGRLTVHRQHGSDLVFEAYNVDIAASD